VRSVRPPPCRRGGGARRREQRRRTQASDHRVVRRGTVQRRDVGPRRRIHAFDFCTPQGRPRGRLGWMNIANFLGLVVGLFIWLLLTGALVKALRQPYRKIDEALRPHWVAATIFTVACLAVVLAWGAALVGIVRFLSGYPGPAAGILGLT